MNRSAPDISLLWKSPKTLSTSEFGTSPSRSFWPAGLRDLLANFIRLVSGKARVTGWMNIYRAGFYHRAGKPGVYDRHPGDLYPTREAALADIEPRHLYVGTVSVSWWEDAQPHTNSASSVPVPVATSRRILARERGEFIDGAWTPQSQLDEERLAAARDEVMQLAYLNPMM
jgi:hypothetical protein